MTSVDPYIRRVRPVRIIDGDTVVMDVDLGYGVTSRHSVRVLGVDCPEVRGDDREAGLRAKAYTERWLLNDCDPSAPWPYLMRSVKADSFGRYLGDIYTVTDLHLAQALLDSGHAVPFMA